MDDLRLGGVFRAIRLHRRLRQVDAARSAGVSQSTVSRIERGRFATLPLDAIRAVAGVLEVRVDIVPRWRGDDLDRIVNARHSALHEALAARLSRLPGWVSEAEMSYSIYGERGVIDRLAFHAGRRSLVVFELKADLSDPAGLVGQLDRYRRLAPVVARGRGWDAASISCWAVVADTDTNRRRLAGHRTLLRGALPADGRALAVWLRDPSGRLDGLTFLACPHTRTGTRSLAATKRVRAIVAGSDNRPRAPKRRS